MRRPPSPKAHDSWVPRSVQLMTEKPSSVVPKPLNVCTTKQFPPLSSLPTRHVSHLRTKIPKRKLLPVQLEPQSLLPHLPFHVKRRPATAKNPRKSVRKSVKSHLSHLASSSDSASSAEEYVDGVVRATVHSREQMWKQFSASVPPPPLSGEQIAKAWALLLQQQLQYAQTHGRTKGTPMKSSSMITLLGKTIGMVTRHAPHLGKPPATWKAKIKQISTLARRDKHLVQRAVPATWMNILEVILELERLKCVTAALFLHLMWICGARGTSIAKLQTANMFLRYLPRPAECPADWNTLSLRFAEGKTSASTDVYTLHVLAPESVIHSLAELQNKAHKQRYLFPSSTQARVAAALKSAHLEIRSARRGALQTLAQGGAQPHEILLYSRHTDVKGLYAYLDDGLEARWEATATFPWSRTLQQAPCEPTQNLSSQQLARMLLNSFQKE